MTQTAHATATTTSERINGLDLAEVARTVEAIANDPALAPAGFRARTHWKGGFRSSTEIDGYDLAGKRIPRRHRIEVDEPVELLGTDAAPNPQELLLTALNACMSVGFVVAASGLGLRIDELRVESELVLDLRGAFGIDPAVPPGATGIRYTFFVRGSGTEAQWNEVHQAMTATSPNRFHLTRPIRLDSKVVVEG